MNNKICVSTPSRICLFGEHQDYLGLEVVASAINLRFHAEALPRTDSMLNVKLSGENISREEIIDISKPISYSNNRDYIKSAVNVLLRKGYKIEHGYDINMTSEIPIGKGMSSSTTMIIAFIKVILEAINSQDKDDQEKIAILGFEAEVKEFNEPGGLMDHYSSALGGLVHLKFNPDKTEVIRIDHAIPKNFILFDSLQIKNTTKVLADAKYPVLEALEELKPFGITSIRDFHENKENLKLLDKLDDIKKKKIAASIDNYEILLEGKEMFEGGTFCPNHFGELLKRHHGNLRDGLGISTPIIEEILNTAYENGALGGKVNGSGGGGCCYVYADEKDSEKILAAVKAKGYPGVILRQDSGVRRD